jgi:flagellar biogenesis protein FliO
MEEMIEAIAQFIGQVGFPIFVAVYVLMRLEPTINRLNDTVKVLTIITAKQSGIDYDGVLREYDLNGGKRR